MVQLSQGRSYQGSQVPRLQHGDFVHAIVTSKEHEHLALESRMYRQVAILMQHEPGTASYDDDDSRYLIQI